MNRVNLATWQKQTFGGNSTTSCGTLTFFMGRQAGLRDDLKLSAGQVTLHRIQY
jgi:hypothetical protein